MKAFLIIFAAVVAISSCEKGGTVTPSPGFFGKYELRRQYGGIYYRDSISKPGNGTIYQFNSDSTYKHFTKGKLDAQGVYHIKIYNNPAENTISNKQIFFDNTQYGEAFSIKGTTITIGTTITDNIASDYEKIAN